MGRINPTLSLYILSFNLLFYFSYTQGVEKKRPIRPVSSPHGKSFLGVTSRDGFSLETNTNAAVSFAESTTLLHPDRQSAFPTSCIPWNWTRRFPAFGISLWSWLSFVESTTLPHPDWRKAFPPSCTCRNWMKRFPESCISLWSWKLLEWEIPEVGRLPSSVPFRVIPNENSKGKCNNCSKSFQCVLNEEFKFNHCPPLLL